MRRVLLDLALHADLVGLKTGWNGLGIHMGFQFESKSMPVLKSLLKIEAGGRKWQLASKSWHGKRRPVGQHDLVAIIHGEYMT